MSTSTAVQPLYTTAEEDSIDDGLGALRGAKWCLLLQIVAIAAVLGLIKAFENTDLSIHLLHKLTGL